MSHTDRGRMTRNSETDPPPERWVNPRAVAMLLGCDLRRSEFLSVTANTIKQRQAPFVRQSRKEN